MPSPPVWFHGSHHLPAPTQGLGQGQRENPTNENWEFCDTVTPKWQTKTWLQVHPEVHLPPHHPWGSCVPNTHSWSLLRGRSKWAKELTELSIPRQDVFYSPGYGAKAKLWLEAPRFQCQVLLLTLWVCGQRTIPLWSLVSSSVKWRKQHSLFRVVVKITWDNLHKRLTTQ